MKGYKVFNPDWTCRKFQYEVGEVYEMKSNPVLCEKGFHFCEKIIGCFKYYNFNPKNKVAEIEALGKIVKGENKSCTNKIKIVKELSWNEVLELVNIGYDNSGYGNSGYQNSGHYNTGYRNSGHCNSGNWNSGHNNSGHFNYGNLNSGNLNSGNNNSGNHNSGNWNTGDWNTGNYNSGDLNSGDYNSGIFNTETNQKIYMFNKLSEWTYKDWQNSEARWIVKNMPEENRQSWWDELLLKKDKKAVLNLPNFDEAIFKEITGITISSKDYL